MGWFPGDSRFADARVAGARFRPTDQFIDQAPFSPDFDFHHSVREVPHVPFQPEGFTRLRDKISVANTLYQSADDDLSGSLHADSDLLLAACRKVRQIHHEFHGSKVIGFFIRVNEVA